MMKKILYACLAACTLPAFSPAAMSAAVDGAAVFNRNCSVCHSVSPPPKSAPPVIPLASRYHLKFATKEQGVAHMVSYLKKPDKNRAVEPQAVTRFGLMPAIALSDAELKAVASWFWDQYNPAMGMGRGMGMGQGPCLNQ